MYDLNKDKLDLYRNYNKPSTIEELNEKQVEYKNSIKNIKPFYNTKYMKDQYGFEDPEIEIINKIQVQMKNNKPKATQKELEWEFTGAISGLVYDSDNSFLWNQTAGQLWGGKNQKSKTEEEYFTKELDLSQEEYKLLRYKVRVQNQTVGMNEPKKYSQLDSETKENYKKSYNVAKGTKLSDDEFEVIWDNQINNFRNKGDMAHQLITTATMLNSDLDKTGLFAKAFFLGNDDEKDIKAGWGGDVEFFKTSSMGNDDYIADLDSENIDYIMNRDNISLNEATHEYYKYIKNGGNRGELFLQHTSEEEVFKYTLISYIKKYAEEYAINGYNHLNKEEFMQLLLADKKTKDTYNFVKNLNEKSNNLITGVQ